MGDQSKTDTTVEIQIAHTVAEPQAPASPPKTEAVVAAANPAPATINPLPPPLENPPTININPVPVAPVATASAPLPSQPSYTPQVNAQPLDTSPQSPPQSYVPSPPPETTNIPSPAIAPSPSPILVPEASPAVDVVSPAMNIGAQVIAPTNVATTEPAVATTQPLDQLGPAVSEPDNGGVLGYTDSYQATQASRDVASREGVRKLAKVAVIGLIGLVIIAGGVFGIHALASTDNDLTSYSFTNNNTKYSLEFFKDSKAVDVGGTYGVEGTDISNKGDTVIVTVYEDSTTGDCNAAGNQSTFGKVKIAGSSYYICGNSKGTIMYSDFKYNNSWQEAAIYSQNLSTQMSVKTTKSVLGSVKILN